ncbi:HET-domain-containing protein [Dendrothele bispora CBS 962.96]|uniref:HET-domain-containing protein n=1 Tax=Dendrothele bispora (strain CBS 962.96) TaxID=1314807 RepID=A0A4S8LSB1_DENBC|nr:HET-domain-containing protein [Dendrothele bispora CBS 962.96]
MGSQDLPFEIKDLVCDYCWNTVFSVESFRTLWTSRAISTKKRLVSFTTRPWAEIQESANKCHFCRLLRQDLLQEVKNSISLSADEAFLVYLGFRRHAERLVLDVEAPDVTLIQQTYIVCATEDDVSAGYIAMREVIPPKDTDMCFSHLLKSIENCTHHDKCREVTLTMLPTRVLDCSNPAQVRLVISDPSAREFYVTLSYVWGEDQPYRTTIENINAYSTLIEQRFIPKTVQDAIIVTHKLGLRYLWVDSFCIMQDSDSDKAQEIANIRTYFSQSFITIVAVGTERVSDGFLHDQPKWSRDPITLPFRCPNGPIGSMRLYKDEVPPFNATEVRAWCLEERILSPRCLLFCSHAVQYECPTTHTNINDSSMWLGARFPLLPVVQATTSDSDLDPSESYKNSWNRLLMDYTMCKLTKSKDKLVAFAGIAEFFHGLWPDSRYVAGLWTHHFPEALLWSTKGVTPTRYRAPSWSWAAVNGIIGSSVIIQDEFPDPPHRVLCDIRQCEISLKWEGDPYGEVTSGLLVIETSIMPAIWEWDSEEEFTALIRMNEGEEDKKPPYAFEDYLGIYYADTAEFLETRCRVILAALLEAEGAVYGLVLVPTHANFEVDRDKEVYRRIGLFNVDAVLRWKPTSTRTLHIV